MRARTLRRRPFLLVTTVVGALLVPLAPTSWAQDAAPSGSPAPSATPGVQGMGEPDPQPSPSATPTAVLRMSTSAASVVAGAAVTLSTRVVTPEGRALPGEGVDVFSRQGGTTSLVRIGRVTTDASGLAWLTWRPRVSAEYSLRRVAGPVVSSMRVVVHVQPLLSAAMTPASVQTGGTGLLRGTLRPAYAGARLQVQRRSPDGSWRGVAVIGTSGTGTYSWSVRPGVGRHVFRAVLPATMAHRGVATAPVALSVLADPTLRQGDRGTAVRVLEQRLLAQKVDVGAVDGVFDADLRHGVTAFQKSQGLARTGAYDAATRSRLANPAPVRLRYPGTGRAVEIDLVKQVLYLSEGGALRRIVDVSSGNDQPYTVDGVTYRAFTPTGRFRVTRKIDGLRVSRLGELYRPAYFHQGWAIHGSPSVPPYPASHGCIRVTNNAQNRLFPLLTVGTPVSIYR